MADRTLPRLLQTPAVLLLLVWMIVPLSMTLFFSFIRYVLNNFLHHGGWHTDLDRHQTDRYRAALTSVDTRPSRL